MTLFKYELIEYKQQNSFICFINLYTNTLLLPFNVNKNNESDFATHG